MALGAAVGRSDLVLSSAHNDITAEAVPALLGRHFGTVTVEGYPGDLEVPSPEPVLAYLTSIAADPLTAAQEAAARALIEARIAADGVFHIHKHTVLITAQQ
jgi:hypothetical protein